jgi:hypothetical protein
LVKPKDCFIALGIWKIGDGASVEFLVPPVLSNVVKKIACSLELISDFGLD